MSEPVIQCPNCGEQFPLDAAFREHFEHERQQAVANALTQERETAKAVQQARERQLREDIEQQQRQELANLVAELDESKRALASQEQDHQRALERERNTVNEQAEQHYRLEIQEKDEELRRMGDQLAAMERRTRQGSMELQGEALEVWLKQQLQAAFPQDSIDDVKKGQRGADLVQQVVDSRGRCGAIVWESKNTKAWNADWIEKLREDVSREGADLGVIVSVALPQGVRSFDRIDGVWVCNVDCAPALGGVLRQQLVAIAGHKRAMTGREGKMESVYAYLVGEQFRDRVERIVSTWEALRNQVDAEERAMQRQWKERRKQLNIMIDVTTDMYTDISAIIGAEQLPEVGGLSISALPSGEEEREVS
ncbi:MAG: DUF2130 domain-containing protein [Anaerolineaceae bacterium]|nr:DUF2130 domain-containing protein [Anaerolineaceae bacterium]